MATTVYATLAEVKVQLGISTTNEDANLNTAIEAASRTIDMHTRRRFFVDDAVSARIFTPEFPDIIWIPDVSTLSGVIVKTDTTDDGAYDTTWTLDDRNNYGYRLEPVNAVAPESAVEDTPFTRIVTVASEFPVVRYSTQITALWGWPAVPGPVVSACIMWSTRLWKRKDAILGVAGGAEIGFVELARRMDPDVQHMIDPYRRMTVGAV